MLVVGASGGVGTYAVQIAVAMGATVTGVASGSKADLVTSLGAEHVIDYTKEDFADGAHRYDVVLAIGGMTSVSHLRRALTPKGTLVIVGGESDSTWSPGMGRQLTQPSLSPFVAQRLVSVLNKEHYSGLERLAELASSRAESRPASNSHTRSHKCLRRSAGSKPATSAAKPSSPSDRHGYVSTRLSQPGQLTGATLGRRRSTVRRVDQPTASTSSRAELPRRSPARPSCSPTVRRPALRTPPGQWFGSSSAPSRSQSSGHCC